MNRLFLRDRALSYYLNFEISILLVIFVLGLAVLVIRNRINRP